MIPPFLLYSKALQGKINRTQHDKYGLRLYEIIKTKIIGNNKLYYQQSADTHYPSSDSHELKKNLSCRKFPQADFEIIFLSCLISFATPIDHDINY